MAEEEVGPIVSPPAPVDVHKRKHDELESEEAPESTPVTDEPVADPISEPDDAKDVVAIEDKVSDSFDAKRPRLDEKHNDLANENGHELTDKENDELPEENAKGIGDHEKQIAVVEQSPDEESLCDSNTEEKSVPENTQGIGATADDSKLEDDQAPARTENQQLDDSEKPAQDGAIKSADEAPQQGDAPGEQYLDFGSQSLSRKIEVPNNKVGVLIGKSGDTIRLLQSNSGAKIQITRDADADPRSSFRPVELVGTLESINKAESLIRDVIAEADAGGSPSLVARGFTTVVPTGAAEQIQLQVPNEKVGMIIGKGGETIKSLQTRSGARIQLVPQHLPEGDQSKERTVRVSGDKKQIETARELIKEVMSQPVRPSPLSHNYNQQAYRPRGPSGPKWGGRGPHSVQPVPYDYQQRGPYPTQNQQLMPSYGAYPSHVPPRGSFGSGWEQRPPMQGPPHGGGYDYYGQQGGHMANVPATAPHSSHAPGHPSGHSMSAAVGPPNSHVNYNYGQPRAPDYGQPAPYSQTAAPHQGYAQGYAEPKYENQGSLQQPYGAHVTSQSGSYPDASHQGYQQHFNRPLAYGMVSQVPQSYGPPAAGQPGDASYQAPNVSAQPYGPNMAPQPSYPYASSGIAQTPYGSAPATNDSYHQPPAASGAVPAYPQQAGQPVSGYGQPGSQQPPLYAQGSAPAAAYGQYASQPGYSEQPAPTAATYAYQGLADAAYAGGQAYSAAPTGQQGYAQPVPAQASYDQSVAQSGSYTSVPPVGAVGYGKSLSPQPQPGYPTYDSSQVYGASR